MWVCRINCRITTAIRILYLLALTLMLSNIDIEAFDAVAAEEYGDIRARLEKAGTPIGSLDILIAAHAKALGCTLVTINGKEFSRVEGLRVENWV